MKPENETAPHADERRIGRPEPERDLIERLRDTPNWMRESYGSWKDCVLTYDRAPFEAADALSVLRCQVESLHAALVKVLDTHEKEAKAYLTYQTALDNYSADGREREATNHMRAMHAASSAEREARLLLATLKTHRGKE